ncbi:MAG: MotA/TolQ/ExbB proton channel family protein [Methylotenera sp.]|nr:MotA/TolQ/ExbB proton channel family protein [Oligoflexia bacterium]
MLTSGDGILGFIKSGGFAMYPLLICSLVGWAVIFERLWVYRRLNQDLKTFHLEAIHALLRGDKDALKALCATGNYTYLPTARLLMSALERLNSKDERLRQRWVEALERRRLVINQELRKNLWVLGTIASSTPFIGLLGTVVGILESFHQMAQKGTGGFAVVASGISEALIATAGGLVVAVIAVIAYNAFQAGLGKLTLTVKIHTEEFVEMLSAIEAPQKTAQDGA